MILPLNLFPLWLRLLLLQPAVAENLKNEKSLSNLMIGDDSYYDNHTFINLFQTEDDKQQEELMILKFITTEFRALAIRPIAFHPGILRPK